MKTALWLLAALAALLLCAQPSGWWCLAGAVICVACLVMAHLSERPDARPVAAPRRDPESAGPCRGVGTPRQAAGNLVDWLDRRLVRLVLGGLAGSFAGLLLALVLVVTAGCEMKDDSGTDGKTDGRCGELTDGCSP